MSIQRLTIVIFSLMVLVIFVLFDTPIRQYLPQAEVIKVQATNVAEADENWRSASLISSTVTTTLELPPISPGNALNITQLAQVGQGVVQAIQWSPDGKTMAVATTLGVYLYQADTLQELQRLETQRPVTLINFSPAGDILISGSIDGQIQAWDLASGQQLYVLQGGGVEPTFMAISSDGRTASVRWDNNFDHQMQLWEVQTGRLLQIIDALEPTELVSPDLHTRLIHRLEGTTVLDISSGKTLYTLEEGISFVQAAFSPDGRSLAISADDDTIRIYEVATGQRLHIFEGQDYSYDLAFSPNSQILASGGADDTVILWDVVKGQRLHTLTGQAYWYSFAFTQDGRFLAVGGADSSLQLWEIQTGQAIRNFEGRPSGSLTSDDPHLSLNQLAFSPTGQRLVSESETTFQLWEIETGQLLAVFDKQPPQEFVFTSDETLFVPTSYQTTIWHWDEALGRLLYNSLITGTSPIAVSPDGNRLVTGGENNTAQLWEVSTGQLLHQLQGHTKALSGMAFTPDGTLLASSARKEPSFGSGPADNSDLRLWRVDTGELLSIHDTYPWAMQVQRFISDKFLLTTGNIPDSCGRGNADTTALWHLDQLLSSKAEIEPIRKRGGASGVSLSASGNIITSYSQDTPCLRSGIVSVWETATGKNLLTLPFEPDFIDAYTLNPEGTIIAVGLNNGSFGLWDITTGQRFHSFVDPSANVTGQAYNSDRANVTSLVYSPDGQVLASGHREGHIQLWATGTHQLLQTLQGHTATVTGLIFSASGDLLISGSDDGTIRLWGQQQ